MYEITVTMTNLVLSPKNKKIWKIRGGWGRGTSTRVWLARLSRGAAVCGLPRRWVPWPRVPGPAIGDPAPRPARGRRRDSQQPTSKSRAALPSSGSFVATHDHYRCRLGTTCSNSSCSRAQCPGEAIPRPPVSAVLLPFVPGDCRGSGLQQPDLTLLLSGLPKADPGHWWASFFFGKPTLPLLAMVLESPGPSESAGASPTGSPATWLRKWWGSSNLAASRAHPTAGLHPERPPPAATPSCQASFQGTRLIRAPPLHSPS
ncbi:uncharacterized protein LOC100513894 [Sus scrofa]|uniref:uncharacterized protein LOC100513894 n=1 Tax=Sus scrofa TaxID=9823 RepID=UPI000A2B50BE|nr:uncharacterized protein LOC100513894 [Sus scrofa]